MARLAWSGEQLSRAVTSALAEPSALSCHRKNQAAKYPAPVFTWIGSLTNNVNTLVTVELYPRGNETDLVLTHERLPTPAIVEGHTRGWGKYI